VIAIRTIKELGKTYRNFRRYEQVLMILLKYGFGDIVLSLNLEHVFMSLRKIMMHAVQDKLENTTRPERVRMALEDLGPTFIKLGQIMSTRPDLIPMSFITELEKLQDNVPSFPYEEVEQIIANELGAPTEELFQTFNKEPLAAASIGQTHRAELKTGEQVVIKVQRPNIRGTVEADLEIMMHIASMMEKHIDELEIYHPTAIVSEFARSLSKELDFTMEAFSVDRFATMFTGNKTIHVPTIFHEFSTSTVMCMEFIDGAKSTDVEKIKELGCDMKKLAKAGVNLVMEQVFVHGFFHGDPHPGNIFILPDNVICFIDFGMMGRVSHSERDDFLRLLLSLLRKDERRITRAALRLTLPQDELEIEKLERDIGEIVDENLYRPMKDIDTGRVLDQLTKVLTTYRLQLKPNLFLLLKAMISIERLAHIYDDELNVFECAEPYVKKMNLQKLSPKNIIQNMMDPVQDMFEMAVNLPRSFQSLLDKLRKGEITINVQQSGFEPMLETLHWASSHIAFSIVLAALIIGSSLVVHAKAPPVWGDVSIIGIVGYTFSALLGFLMLFSTLHHRHITLRFKKKKKKKK
jgi:ubiquinone biosynthesis protein